MSNHNFNIGDTVFMPSSVMSNETVLLRFWNAAMPFGRQDAGFSQERYQKHDWRDTPLLIVDKIADSLEVINLSNLKRCNIHRYMAYSSTLLSRNIKAEYRVGDKIYFEKRSYIIVLPQAKCQLQDHTSDACQADHEQTYA